MQMLVPSRLIRSNGTDNIGKALSSDASVSPIFIFLEKCFAEVGYLCHGKIEETGSIED